MSASDLDAVIVGSGPGGSTAADVLTAAGWSVVIVEKGRNHLIDLDDPHHVSPCLRTIGLDATFLLGITPGRSGYRSELPSGRRAFLFNLSSRRHGWTTVRRKVSGRNRFQCILLIPAVLLLA